MKIAALTGEFEGHRASRHLDQHFPGLDQAEVPSRAGDRSRARSRRRSRAFAALEDPSCNPALAQDGRPLEVHSCRAGIAFAALSRVPVAVSPREGNPRKRGVAARLSQSLDARQAGCVGEEGDAVRVPDAYE